MRPAHVLCRRPKNRAFLALMAAHERKSEPKHSVTDKNSSERVYSPGRKIFVHRARNKVARSGFFFGLQRSPSHIFEFVPNKIRERKPPEGRILWDPEFVSPVFWGGAHRHTPGFYKTPHDRWFIGPQLTDDHQTNRDMYVIHTYERVRSYFVCV